MRGKGTDWGTVLTDAVVRNLSTGEVAGEYGLSHSSVSEAAKRRGVRLREADREPKQPRRSTPPVGPPGAVSVPLTRGKFAWVDPDDAPALLKLNWCCNPNGYAYLRRGRRIIFMHQMVLGVPPGMEVDHINRDRLDNRKCNLRPATEGQTADNSNRRRDNKSGFKGVHPHHDGWRAQIRHRGTRYDLGTFSTKEQAAVAYQRAALRLKGEYAHFDIPKE